MNCEKLMPLQAIGRSFYDPMRLQVGGCWHDAA